MANDGWDFAWKSELIFVFLFSNIYHTEKKQAKITLDI
jgi:hypothetical protein